MGFESPDGDLLLDLHFRVLLARVEYDGGELHLLADVLVERDAFTRCGGIVRISVLELIVDRNG